ncbi:MAG: Spi family protease inhibitor [Bacteroidales bacterium]|nr:Spi family protease inhibitor [Bacteroidales bacterium]
MKKSLIISTLLGAFLTSLARPIDLQTAESIATKFMGTNNLHLVSTYKTDENAASFYVFNTSDGFVIVSADNCETPIIAYSHEGRFDPENVPVQMQDYLQAFVERMQYGIENQIFRPTNLTS